MRIGEQFGSFASGFRFAVKLVRSIESGARTLEETLSAKLHSPLYESARLSHLRRWVNPWTAFVLFAILLLWRNHWWISNPQFYIEDGPEFYAKGFDFGNRTLFETYMGYFHLIPRMVVLFACHFHPRYGPLLVELAALLIQAWVGAFFISRRLRPQIPSLTLRFLMGLLVIVYPYSNELAVNIAHSQWYLAIGSVLILCARPGRSVTSKGLDYLVITPNALTGPFSLILAVLAWYMVKPRRKQDRVDGHRVAIAVLLTLAAVWTGYLIFQHPRLGVHGKPRFSLLERMISSQVVIGSTYGLSQVRNTRFVAEFDEWEFAYAVFCFAVMLYGFTKGSRFVKAFAGLAGFTLVTSLYSGSNWVMLGAAGVGERYFFFLGLLFVWSCYLASVRVRPVAFRWFFRYLLFATCVGVLTNWVYDPPYHRFDYPPQIAGYDALALGTRLKIKTPIDRKKEVDGWITELIKK